MSFEQSSFTGAKPTWIISISSEDAPGLLSKMMSAISALGLSVLSADIKTSAGRVTNQFHVTRKDDLKAQTVVDAIKASLA